MAQHRLPFPFNVVAKLPTVNPRPAANPKPTGGRKRNIGQVEPPEGTLPNVESRRVRTRFDPPLQSGPLGNEPIDHPMPATHPRNAPQDPESSSSSSPPPTMPHPQPPRNAGLASDPSTVSKPPDQAVPPPPPPRIDGEPAPTLTEVNPESGSITGGARIWLKGMEFPAVFTLFARFGTAVVPTVSHMVLICGSQLTKFLRPFPPVTFLLVIYLPPPPARQASSMLRYRSIPNPVLQSMEPVSRSFIT